MVEMAPFFAIATLQIVFPFAFCSLGVAHADDNDQEKEFCPIEATIDLTYAKKNDSGFLADDGVFFPEVSARFRAGTWHGCICDIKPCVAFCPQENVTGSGMSVVVGDYGKYSAITSVFYKNLTLVDDEDTLSPDQRFHTFEWHPCPGKGMYFLEPEINKKDRFYLLENGSLFVPDLVDYMPLHLNFKEYCLRRRGNNTIYTPKVCVIEEESVEEFGPAFRKDNLNKVVNVGNLVAVPFLIATVIVYSVLPELRTIHGKTLRCYLCCLALTYVVLAVDYLTAGHFSGTTFCLCRVFTIQFLILATFLWLNVMCFNLWWKFGHFASFQSTSDRKKFVAYSIYAWGITAVMTAVSFAMEFSPGIPESIIRPGFMEKDCWFKTKKEEALYLYGPASVAVACNICLFVATSFQVYKHNKNTQRHLNSGESRRHDDTKQWFSLYMKLFVVMGVTWSMDIISWVWEGPEYFWFVSCIVSSLQGILIFVIFVCKANVWELLKKRYKNKMHGCSICTTRNSVSDSLTSPETSVTNESKNSSTYFEDGSQVIRMNTLNRPVVV